jgi:hypothetical protein
VYEIKKKSAQRMEHFSMTTTAHACDDCDVITEPTCLKHACMHFSKDAYQQPHAHPGDQLELDAPFLPFPKITIRTKALFGAITCSGSSSLSGFNF